MYNSWVSTNVILLWNAMLQQLLIIYHSCQKVFHTTLHSWNSPGKSTFAKIILKLKTQIIVYNKTNIWKTIHRMNLWFSKRKRWNRRHLKCKNTNTEIISSKVVFIYVMMLPIITENALPPKLEVLVLLDSMYFLGADCSSSCHLFY